VRLGYRFFQLLAQVLFILLCRIRVYGRRHVPRTGGVLLVSNHQCYFDPVIVTLALPRECHFMGRDNLFTGLGGRFIRYLNAFPVRRASADVSAIKEALRRLKSGALLVVFPEGTRSPDGRIGDFLPGAAGIALRAKCVIVPTLVDGATAFWPRESRFPRLAPVTVHHDRPMSAAEAASYSPEALAGELARRIRDLQRNVRCRYRIPAAPSTPVGGGDPEHSTRGV
jgi:1-acyl-sn-glycerol-3-phosphate acyltransferase